MKIYLQRLRTDKVNKHGLSKYRWKWQVVHHNGTIIANSVMYKNRQTAEKTLALVREGCAGAVLEIIMET